VSTQDPGSALSFILGEDIIIIKVRNGVRQPSTDLRAAVARDIDEHRICRPDGNVRGEARAGPFPWVAPNAFFDVIVRTNFNLSRVVVTIERNILLFVRLQIRLGTQKDQKTSSCRAPSGLGFTHFLIAVNAKIQESKTDTIKRECKDEITSSLTLSLSLSLDLSLDLARALVLSLCVCALRHSTRTARQATLVLWAAPARPVQQVFLAPCQLRLAHDARADHYPGDWQARTRSTLVRLIAFSVRTTPTRRRAAPSPPSAPATRVTRAPMAAPVPPAPPVPTRTPQVSFHHDSNVDLMHTLIKKRLKIKQLSNIMKQYLQLVIALCSFFCSDNSFLSFLKLLHKTSDCSGI
jgi:hypothetical protein